MDTNKFVGEKIKSLREEKGLSREELARQSGIGIEQMERIESNTDLPSLAPLIKIARVLGVRLGTFLDQQQEVGPVVCRKDEVMNSIEFSNNALQSRRHMTHKEIAEQLGVSPQTVNYRISQALKLLRQELKDYLPLILLLLSLQSSHTETPHQAITVNNNIPLWIPTNL